MNTLMLTNSDDDIARAAQIIKGGGLVAFPTETVYGLGANALDEAAVQKIFRAKGRPGDNPLIVHISGRSALDSLVSHVPDAAKRLMDLYWPGPLTIVMKKSGAVGHSVTAGLDTVGIRMPENPTALRLIERSGVPIAAPSANISGRPSPTAASHVAQDLSGRIDAILDGGKCNVGLESTVVDLSGEVPMLLRPGGITYEQLTGALGAVEQRFECKNGETPRSPGLKYRHYAPRSPLVVVRGDFLRFVRANAPKYKRVGVITYDRAQYPANCSVKYLGDNPRQYAASLFGHLRSLDGEQVDIIFARDISVEGINLATRNRLYKAAGYNIVTVG